MIKLAHLPRLRRPSFASADAVGTLSLIHI